MGCMHACPHFLHLGVAVDSDTLFYVHLLPVGSKLYSLGAQGELSPRPQRVLGGRDACLPTFKTPSMHPSSLHHKEVMDDGYQPKMVLYTLDELFYVFDNVKKWQSTDEKIIVAYEILCLSALQCTEQWHGVEKTSMPDALALLNVNDACHLKYLTWAVYDKVLLVGGQPKLPGNCPWCMVLAGLYKHIYRGHEDAAHCPPHTLASWDSQERIEVLCRGGRLSSMWGSQRGASRPWRRSRSSSRCHSQTLAQGDRNGCSHSSSPCTPLRCHCRATLSPDANTMPKLASAVNVLSHAWSSHSRNGLDLPQ